MGSLLPLLLSCAWASVDPAGFGHVADNSVERPGAVSAPEWRLEPGARHRAALQPLHEGEKAHETLVPLPADAPQRARDHSRPRGPLNPSGLILLGMGAALAAALKIRRPSPVTTASPTVEVLLLPPREPEPAAPLPFWSALPEPEPLRLDPVPPLPWWSVSDAEQEALTRWGGGAQGLALGDWLDAHRTELPGVDVERLKSKLAREA